MATYPDSRIIQTSCGPIVGRRLIHEGDKQVDAFQGVPFAKPPIGKLRFQPAQPHEPWTEIRECKAFGNRAMQKIKSSESPGLPPVSEDCLFLNIFAPVWEPKDKEGFAVIVFLHGGAFLSDSSVKYGDLTLCEHLCKKDIIMVTIQFRLGFFGMFTTGDEICPGMQTLWDQIFALQWLRENISYFGGNPNNISLMGHSAGGYSVDILNMSPHATDLFHKVILMAGNVACPRAIQPTSVDVCKRKAKSLGIDPSDSQKCLEDMQKVPVEELISSIHEPPEGTYFSLMPRVDGDLIPKQPDELRKDVPAKPTLIGMTEGEGLMPMMMDPLAKRDDYIESIASIFFPENDYPSTFIQLRQEYVAKVQGLITGDKNSTVLATLAAAGDEFLAVGTLKVVLGALKSGEKDVYLYKMDYFNPDVYKNPIGEAFPLQAATHGGDIAYIVGTSTSFAYTFNEVDMEIVEKMTTLWANFAKFSNPNGITGEVIKGTEEWLPATLENPERHLQINIQSRVSNDFYGGRPMWVILQAEKYKNKK